MAVGTLFDIFSECAELNPEPCDGEWDYFLMGILGIIVIIQLCVYICYL